MLELDEATLEGTPMRDILDLDYADGLGARQLDIARGDAVSDVIEIQFQTPHSGLRWGEVDFTASSSCRNDMREPCGSREKVR